MQIMRNSTTGYATAALLLLFAQRQANAFSLPRSLEVRRLVQRSVATDPSATSVTTSKSNDGNDSNDSNVGNDSDKVPQPNDETEADDNKFDWTKAWYPLAPVEFLDETKPHKFELLGQSVVVWNDAPSSEGKFEKKKKNSKKTSEGTWRVFVDECPHRKVPLSEGRIEADGTLLCSYHGWRFQGDDGSCVTVPQIEQTNELEILKQNPKSKCNSFPTKIIEGLLFVWASSDENAALESALTPVKYRESDETEWKGPWGFRELPYGQDFFIENVVDPSHVTVSHHGTAGSRYADQRMEITTTVATNKQGFQFTHKHPEAAESLATVTFEAPCYVNIEERFGKDGLQVLELYATPSRPGFCWHIGRMVVQKGTGKDSARLLAQFTLPLPTWLNHIVASAFLNQDALFLHHQERHMARSNLFQAHAPTSDNDDASTSTKNLYSRAVLPTSIDKGVLNYRNWLRIFAGGNIPYKYGPSTLPPADNEAIFDVWNSHTKHCKYCLAALRRLKMARFASYTLAAAFVKRSLVASGLLAGLGLMLHKLIGMFYRYEYSHSNND